MKKNRATFCSLFSFFVGGIFLMIGLFSAEPAAAGAACTVGALTGTCESIVGCVSPKVNSGASNCVDSICCTTAPATVSCSVACKATCGSTETNTGACSSEGYCCMPAGAGGGTSTVIEFRNPLRFNTVEEVFNNALSTLQTIIVILALVFIVIGAILYITSSGDEGRMKTAKAAITASLIGLALGLAAPSFLKEIGNVLGWNNVTSSAVSGAKTLTEIATNVLNFLLSVVGILGVIMLVIGGIMYLTAAGDENRVDTGKKIVTYSIIGILVALAALVMVNQIAAFFV